jgi:hypothetical protein
MSMNPAGYGNFLLKLLATIVVMTVGAAVADVPDAVHAPDSWLNLSPGSDATKLNISWATRHADTALPGGRGNCPGRGPKVQIVNVRTGDTATFSGTVRQAFFSYSTGIVSAGWYQNKVTVSGLAPSTGYTYRVGHDTVWSGFYPFQTRDPGVSFRFIAVGDPQLGAKTSPAPPAQKSNVLGYDSAGWSNTIAVASHMVPEASFLLSAGDQIESITSPASEDSQYNVYFSPAQLLSIPVATVDGNHDYGLGPYFGYHFNHANQSPDFGVTRWGNDGDYWFSYGKVLFMVLNSNTESAATHDVFIGKAIAANPDAAWKIVGFHHSLYSDGSHGYANDAVILKRNTYPSIMDKYKIDVVLSGHDHSYTRSYQMLGGMPVSRPGDSILAVDPQGTLYMTLNSGSGSKYYQLNPAYTVNGVTMYPVWSAVYWQQNQPTFSAITVSRDTFSIVTYAITGTATTRIDSYTIIKSGRTGEVRKRD